MKFRIPLLLLLLLLAKFGFSQPNTRLENFVLRVNSLPVDLKASVVDSFMTAVPSFPFIENDTVANFIFRGVATSVAYGCEFNDWATTPMQKLAGTDFWYLKKIYKSDTRLDYRFVVNGTNMVDPRNPHTIMGFILNSELRMSNYVPAPEIVYDSNIPHGQIITSNFTSTYLGNTRTIKVYLPPSYATATSESFPLVIFHDGLEFLSVALANNTLDYLIHNKKIKPVVCVFIPPIDRTNEYAGTKRDLFSSFITKEILPKMSEQYRILSGAENIATIGISNGGDISQYLGLKLSDKIGNVGSMSAGNHNFMDYMGSPKLNLRFYIDVGVYDIFDFYEQNKKFAKYVLKANGYDYEFNIYNEGHSWGNWRAHLDNALELFFPYVEPTTLLKNIKNASVNVGLLQNSPNPFACSTKIEYITNQNGYVTIRVFDSLGQEVKILVDNYSEQGKYRIDFDAQSLGGGIYFASLWLDGVRVNTIKMVLVK